MRTAYGETNHYRTAAQTGICYCATDPSDSPDYAKFIEGAVAAGCTKLKAITTTGNEGSIRFHVAQGWQAQEIDDYAGPGRKRIVFVKELAS